MAVSLNSTPKTLQPNKAKQAAAAVSSATQTAQGGNSYAPLSSVVNNTPSSSSLQTAKTAQTTQTKPPVPSNGLEKMPMGYGTGSMSKYDQALPEEYRNTVLEAKREYAIAQQAGDKEGMKTAYNKAQKARAQGGSYVDDVGDGSGYAYFGKDTWSAADRTLLSEQEQATLAEYKKNAALAKTDEERKFWNAQAEKLREPHGYSGGADGSQYNELGILDREYNDTSQYESQYLDKINNLLTGLENAEFSYDYATDPSYQAYLNAFTRQGNSASEAAMAQSAANTGGIASSYAAAVANQMRQAYAQKAADMIPQLEQQAYERYANDLSNRFNLANFYGSLDQNDYQRFANDRDFRFNQWNANYDNAYQQNYDNLYFHWLREQLEKTLADNGSERDWQSKENELDRKLQKYLASLS